jgi:hypothetical protein
MNRQIDKLLQVRAAVNGCRAILKLMAAGDYAADPVDGALLAEYAENTLNAIVETISGRVLKMECILKQADYLELTELAGAATRATTDWVLTLSTSLLATLNPAQQSIFREIEERTSFEAAEAQDGLARLLCGCSDCRGRMAA